MASGSWACEPGRRAVCPQPQRAAAPGQPGLQPAGLAQRQKPGGQGALAALYESWSIPVAVNLVVPLGMLGALGLTALCAKENDVYFQVGLLTTVGLVAKNAILIVEFARELFESGMDALAAVVEAVRLRLRPIVMTSLAFGLGVIPLATATGAGAGAQSAIGVAVLGGMLTGTFLCIFFVPVFYALIIQISGRKKDKTAAAPVTDEKETNHA